MFWCFVGDYCDFDGSYWCGVFLCCDVGVFGDCVGVCFFGGCWYVFYYCVGDCVVGFVYVFVDVIGYWLGNVG